MNNEYQRKRGLRPASPCISICTLDERSYCLGCGRSLDEIVRWSTMSGAEQWDVVDRMASGATVAESAPRAAGRSSRG